MKELTHCIFSAGACIYVLSLLDRLAWPSVIVVLWLSTSVNYVIDVLGHSLGGSIPSRTRLTHSVFTAPLWGALVSATSLQVLTRVVPSLISPSESLLWITMGASIAIGHLLLDSLTQAGVYLWKDRIAIAHFRYNNLVLNAGFIATGLLFIVMATNSTQIPPIHLSLIAGTA